MWYPEWILSIQCRLLYFIHVSTPTGSSNCIWGKMTVTIWGIHNLLGSLWAFGASFSTRRHAKLFDRGDDVPASQTMHDLLSGFVNNSGYHVALLKCGLRHSGYLVKLNKTRKLSSPSENNELNSSCNSMDVDMQTRHRQLDFSMWVIRDLTFCFP